MDKLDIWAIRAKWLRMCGHCDAGLPMGCDCPPDDERNVIMELVDHLEVLYQHYDLLCCSTMEEAVAELELLMEARKKLREVYLMARDQSFTSEAAREIMLLIPPNLLSHRERLDDNMS